MMAMALTKKLRRPRHLPAGLKAGVAALGLAVVAALPLFGNEALTIQGIDILIFILLALSLNLLVGYTGMVSMCHAAFFAIGGYVFGIAQRQYHLTGSSGLFIASLAAILATIAAAFVIGVFVVRVTQAYFIMLTLAFGQLIYVVIWKSHTLTGGDDGLINIVPPSFLTETWSFYYFALLVLAACVAMLYRLAMSPFGQTLAAIRDNPTRTAFVGVNVDAFRLAAFVISAGFAGVAGILQVLFHRGMFPSSANFITSADALVVVVLGGTHYFSGPIVGALVFKLLSFGLPHLTDYWLGALGLVILFVALVLPNGLVDIIAKADKAGSRHG